MSALKHILLLTFGVVSALGSELLVRLENHDDLKDWENSGCVYSHLANDPDFEGCRPNLSYGSINGCWSYCNISTACTLKYTVQKDVLLEYIDVWYFAVQKLSGGSPVLEIVYQNLNGPAGKKTYIVTSDDYQGTGAYYFDEGLVEGATIEITQYGQFAAGTDFLMVARVNIYGIRYTPPPPPPPPTSTEQSRTTTTETFVDCPPDGVHFLPDPKNCSTYFICHDGEMFPDECADGLLFDSEKGQCLPEDQVHCYIYDCPDEYGISFHPFVGTCSLYLMCVSREGTQLECGEGTEFSPEVGKCVLASKYDCPYTL